MATKQALQDQIETLAGWIARSEHLVAFTGAGISTDSGIPDYRGPNGVWTRREKGLPAPQWRVAPDQVAPNASHRALVELQNLGKLKFLVTQNTDNLHRASGIRPDLLAELHGNGELTRCLDCDQIFDRAQVPWDARRWGYGYRTQKPVAGQPACPRCGGRLISSIVNFGDPMPETEMKRAGEHARGCDLMLVLGSSLIVNPAASLVGVAIRSGARVVLVNQGDTPYDNMVALRLWDGIGDVLPPAVERARAILSSPRT